MPSDPRHATASASLVHMPQQAAQHACHAVLALPTQPLAWECALHAGLGHSATPLGHSSVMLAQLASHQTLPVKSALHVRLAPLHQGLEGYARVAQLALMEIYLAAVHVPSVQQARPPPPLMQRTAQLAALASLAPLQPKEQGCAPTAPGAHTVTALRQPCAPHVTLDPPLNPDLHSAACAQRDPLRPLQDPALVLPAHLGPGLYRRALVLQPARPALWALHQRVAPTIAAETLL